LRASFFSINCRGSKFLTSAPIWQAKLVTSKLVIRSTPLLPASSACQTSGALLPTPQMSPMPVTTTRRCKLLRSFPVCVDVVDGVFHRADFLRFLVGNLDIERLFECHYQLDGIQGISTQVVNKRCIGRDFALIYSQLFHNDLLYPLV